VQTTSKEGERLSDFTLKVEQVIPKVAEDGESTDGADTAGGTP
jgi:hypothetical protein